MMGGMGVPVGKGSGIGVIRERKRPAKPQAKRNKAGMYGLSKGGQPRAQYAQGGKSGYSSIGDMEKSCNSRVGMNTMKMEGEK